MFLFLSFIVAIMAIFYLADAATSYTSQDATAAVALFIYSLVCIIRELKAKEDSFFYDDGFYRDHRTTTRTYNKSYNSTYGYDYYDNDSYIATRDNSWKAKDTVEVFAPDKKKEKKDDTRPQTEYHYPSKQEVRDKIAKLSKSRMWRIKRKFFAFCGVDITADFYKPGYVEKKVVARVNKEDHNRYMPKQTGLTWYEQRKLEEEKAEYGKILNALGRSCDIAFDGENFVDEITIKSNEPKATEHCSTSVNDI